jgi:hypothetical protein
MSIIEDGTFFNKQHNRLVNFAGALNVLAWIVFVVHIFLVWAKYVETQNLYNYQFGLSGTSSDFSDILQDNPLYAISLYLEMFRIFISGTVFALVLKGVSLGLKMLLENDLNKRIVDDDTSEPVFYKPEEVIRLTRWISRAMIALIGIVAIISLFSFQNSRDLSFSYVFNLPNAEVLANLLGGIIVGLNIIFVSGLYLFLLKCLNYALRMLMEIEHNSRFAKK